MWMESGITWCHMPTLSLGCGRALTGPLHRAGAGCECLGLALVGLGVSGLLSSHMLTPWLGCGSVCGMILTAMDCERFRPAMTWPWGVTWVHWLLLVSSDASGLP